MERITGRQNGTAFYVESNRVFPVDMSTLGIAEVLERLAQYEDIGYTPQDIKTMHNELCLKCGNHRRAHEGACNGCKWRREV